MSLKRNGVSVAPSVPAANKSEDYLDSSDNLRLKVVNPDSHIDILTPIGLRDYNQLDNGGQTILQRVAASLTTQTTSTTLRKYVCADRWWVMTGNNTSMQYQQVDTIAAPETNLNSRFYSRLKQITNGAKFAYGQAMLGQNIPKLWGRTVRFQLKMRYSVLGGASQKIRLGIVQSTSAATVDSIAGGIGSSFISAWGTTGVDPTLGTNLAYLVPVKTESNGALNGNAVDCMLTNAWQRFSATFVIPSGCVNIVPMVWLDKVCTANDDLLIAEAGLYAGEEIRDWYELPFKKELQRCALTFQKTFPYGTVPAQSAGVSGAAGIVAAAAAYFGGSFDYPDGRMYAVPGTLTTYNPSAGNSNWRDVTAAADKAVAVTNDGDVSVFIASSASASAANDVCRIHFTADAEI